MKLAKLTWCVPEQTLHHFKLLEQADEQLFRSVKCTSTHTLCRLLPPEHSAPYHTLARLHYYELPSKITSTDECNSICRVLYKDRF